MTQYKAGLLLTDTPGVKGYLKENASSLGVRKVVGMIDLTELHVNIALAFYFGARYVDFFHMPKCEIQTTLDAIALVRTPDMMYSEEPALVAHSFSAKAREVDKIYNGIKSCMNHDRTKLQQFRELVTWHEVKTPLKLSEALQRIRASIGQQEWYDAIFALNKYLFKASIHKARGHLKNAAMLTLAYIYVQTDLCLNGGYDDRIFKYLKNEVPEIEIIGFSVENDAPELLAFRQANPLSKSFSYVDNTQIGCKTQRNIEFHPPTLPKQDALRSQPLPSPEVDITVPQGAKRVRPCQDQRHVELSLAPKDKGKEEVESYSDEDDCVAPMLQGRSLELSSPESLIQPMNQLGVQEAGPSSSKKSPEFLTSFKPQDSKQIVKGKQEVESLLDADTLMSTQNPFTRAIRDKKPRLA